MKNSASEQDFYVLSDLLGLPLTVGKTGITGKGSIKSDWGLRSVPMVQKVFASYVDTATCNCALLIGTPQDLGVGVVYYPVSGEVDLFILDRSAMPDRGASVFAGDKPVKSVLDCFERLRNLSKAHFKGDVRKGGFVRRDKKVAA